ncbi:MAG: hypothetical protein NWS55_01570 [Solirubrobacteraceae bacterium]|jgi:haloalkane dehalogenase|nr:hypothetical protein [Solirubrobacteraceae bacterium]
MLTTRAVKLLVATVCLAGLAMPAAANAAKSPISVGVNPKMYNERYCEYLFVHTAPNGARGVKLVGDVWNTFGLNKCPAAQWAASDRTALAALFPGTLTVKTNGPRYWLINNATITWDSRIDPRGGKIRQFPGLKMRFLTSVDVPLNAIATGGMAPYVETIVSRRTDFNFSRKYPIHELVSPAGKVYAMQAYSQIKDKTLKLKDLARLGPKLALPAGWKYRTRKLKKNLTLRTAGATTVLQDELENTYQLVK